MSQHLYCASRRPGGSVVLLACVVAWAIPSAVPAEAAGGRLRVIVETDAGGDPDDEQSLVRFLLYCNEWDVEGIIANRARARDGENRNSERTGLGIVQRQVHAYGECHERLAEHDPRFPDAQELMRRTVPGYEDREEGVRLLLDAVDRDDPRPVWFLNWGTDDGSAPSCLTRALDRVLRERGPEGYAAFKAKLRIVCLGDKFGRHTKEQDPPFRLLIDAHDPDHWYWRFSPLTATAGGFDLKRDALTGHGPLGALYPTNTTLPQKEGDTLSFLYLIPTGMNDPDHPSWGSWSGRYGPHPQWSGRNYHQPNLADTWQGKTGRDQMLERWAVDLQNDFRARLDWCVKPYRDANHPPAVVVNGRDGMSVLEWPVETGAPVELSADGSADPDGHELSYRWFVYPEAGSYRGTVELTGDRSPHATVRLPHDARGQTIHVVLAATDQGQPPLTRYRRIILQPRTGPTQ